MSLELVAGVSGCAAGICSLIFLWQCRLSFRRQTGAFQDSLSAHRGSCETEIGEMKKSVHSLEAIVRTAQMQAQAGLSPGMRAQAVLLLQTGAEHEMVAERLDMKVCEVGLLARVADLIPGEQSRAWP